MHAPRRVCCERLREDVDYLLAVVRQVMLHRRAHWSVEQARVRVEVVRELLHLQVVERRALHVLVLEVLLHHHLAVLSHVAKGLAVLFVARSHLWVRQRLRSRRLLRREQLLLLFFFDKIYLLFEFMAVTLLIF